ncbi:hypothetical protein [Peribacillus cavernae]|uniref:hypothetical protein n=1 Tax=Peribacillus cavernae TaxID=1674310 RepID=UPI0027811CA6|nr:hypothetical protein [Peribacillus cavernae]MDQ0218759.1 hypothetical protein [Peribacillus cavernae]
MRTNSRRKTASMMTFPLNFVLAITFPNNNPKTKTITPKTDAISMESLTGDQKSVAI